MTLRQALDRCQGCGYDAGQWDDTDTLRTIGRAATLVALWASPLRGDQASRRPEPGVWSAAEYVNHLGGVLAAMRLLLASAIEQPGRDLGPVPAPEPPGEPRWLDLDTELATLGREAGELRAELAGLARDRWDNGILLGDSLHSIRWASRHAVHDLWHHLSDIAVIAADLGASLAPARGTVSQLSVSAGGVPKLAVAAAEVGLRGLTGDRQAARVHHGRPWQALCLWSAEVIDALRAEGHPISAGAAGENVTIAGLDWSTLHAGAVLELGEVRCQLSAPAEPCAKNNQWFADGDSRRMDHERHPGWSRWYASVLTPGRLETGDPVLLRPPDHDDVAQVAPVAGPEVSGQPAAGGH